MEITGLAGPQLNCPNGGNIPKYKGCVSCNTAQCDTEFVVLNFQA